MNTHRENIENTCGRIAPAWPLKNMVAVNPYLGFSDTKFEEAAKLFLDRGNVRLTMSLSFYLDQVKQKNILNEDLINAHENLNATFDSLEEFLNNVKHYAKREEHIQWQGSTLIDIASKISEKDWNGLMIDSVSAWAAAYFDDGVSIWNSENKEKGIFASWKAYAELDRTPEIMGLKGIRKTITMHPDDPIALIQSFLDQIKIESTKIEAYLHALLLKIIGWSSFISGVDFNNKLYGGKHDNLIEFLAIILSWETYFYQEYNDRVRAEWYEQMHQENNINQLLLKITEVSVILQEAYDLATQRALIGTFKSHPVSNKEKVPKAQMAFCIDVRSEVYRRNLESVDDSIETIGFAGFFGFPIKYKPLGHDILKNQCPVLIPSALEVKETYHHLKKAENKRTSSHQVRNTWKKFKSSAVTSFGFVSPLGLSFLPRIISDSFGWTRPAVNPNKDGLNAHRAEGLLLDLSDISLEEKTNFATGALTGMGIKDRLAPFVLITGHGSTSVNNPHASGLDCGACGGHSGEINALTAQLILNDPEVRNQLSTNGIEVPEETLFVACLHDTTTDQISVVNENLIPESKRVQFNEIFKSIKIAGYKTRSERSKRFDFDAKSNAKIRNAFINRASDWSQVRPEWGLAGCNAFVIANRNKTAGMDLKGNVFLHNYDWKTDSEFGLLETIITAPMVVTSWINLQYYASTTDNLKFGAGNKTLHNVTAGSGVIEGSGGDLKIGLAHQSIHNGDKYEHLPQKLNVVIEAPIEAINKILQKHESVKQLFDNSWIFLHRLDEHGNISHTYKENLSWNTVKTTDRPVKEKILTI